LLSTYRNAENRQPGDATEPEWWRTARALVPTSALTCTWATKARPWCERWTPSTRWLYCLTHNDQQDIQHARYIC
jgi:hypothetical protein